MEWTSPGRFCDALLSFHCWGFSCPCLQGHFSCLVIKGGSSTSNLALSESETETIRGSAWKISWIPLLLVRKSEELAQASGEQVETVSNLGNKVVSGSKGSAATVHQASATSSLCAAYMDEFDPAVARLNIAIIWYHLHEYSKALSVLEPLYHNIEPIEERTALHVCLLLLDVALACQECMMPFEELM
ncbi:hypothetical protein OIU85_002866 [Salix viminalis]|uniref:CCR4-NOT transcription complex subunit 10 n=1 Tax=Salix viminalis TaxID=40686 RepID=A0A9Q0VPT0_SALVM|nr:hypothetical protein OIU85_002866 [Salix viminalis]